VQYVFLWAWGRQTQGPPRAVHTLATPLPTYGVSCNENRNQTGKKLVLIFMMWRHRNVQF